jgi:hypothetical protein
MLHSLRKLMTMSLQASWMGAVQKQGEEKEAIGAGGALHYLECIPYPPGGWIRGAGVTTTKLRH